MSGQQEHRASPQHEAVTATISRELASSGHVLCMGCSMHVHGECVCMGEWWWASVLECHGWVMPMVSSCGVGQASNVRGALVVPLYEFLLVWVALTGDVD